MSNNVNGWLTSGRSPSGQALRQDICRATSSWKPYEDARVIKSSGWRQREKMEEAVEHWRELEYAKEGCRQQVRNWRNVQQIWKAVKSQKNCDKFWVHVERPKKTLSTVVMGWRFIEEGEASLKKEQRDIKSWGGCCRLLCKSKREEFKKGKKQGKV